MYIYIKNSENQKPLGSCHHFDERGHWRVGYPGHIGPGHLGSYLYEWSYFELRKNTTVFGDILLY